MTNEKSVEMLSNVGVLKFAFNVKILTLHLKNAAK